MYLSSSIWDMIKGKVVAGIWVPAMLISVYSVVLAQLVSDSGSRQGWMFHSSLRSTLLLLDHYCECVKYPLIEGYDNHLLQLVSLSE